MPTSNPTASQATPSLLDISAFDGLTDDDFVSTDEQTRNQVIIALSQNGRVSWDYRMPEHGTPMDEWHGLTVAWTLPSNVRAEPLRELIIEHLNLLEQVHLDHTVVSDGSNFTGELDDDGKEALDEFAALLEEFVKNPDHVVEPFSASEWFEDMQTAFHGLDDDELEDLVREAIHDGKVFEGEHCWVVVDLDEALEYAREIRDDAEDPNNE